MIFDTVTRLSIPPPSSLPPPLPSLSLSILCLMVVKRLLNFRERERKRSAAISSLISSFLLRGVSQNKLLLVDVKRCLWLNLGELLLQLLLLLRFPVGV